MGTLPKGLSAAAGCAVRGSRAHTFGSPAEAACPEGCPTSGRCIHRSHPALDELGAGCKKKVLLDDAERHQTKAVGVRTVSAQLVQWGMSCGIPLDSRPVLRCQCFGEQLVVYGLLQNHTRLTSEDTAGC